MELIVLFIYCFAYISSGNSLSDDTNENIYNSVKIDFPSDPCDTSAIHLPDYNTPGRRVSEVKCFEHTWQLRYNQIKELMNAKCDRIRYNVIGLLGGQRAENGEYPHMHPQANDVLIKDFITHHRYKPPRKYYDIALIKLDAKVSFSWDIHPSCLWTKFENPGTGILTGWGVIDLSTRMTSPVLQRANIQIIDYEECDKKLSQKRNRNWWGFMRHQLCAGNISGGVDTCQGDSGGPLQSLIPLKHPRTVLKWNLHHIIGVTSFGFGCARKDTPSVYTRVASFIGWIEKIVWPDSSYRHNATNDNRFYFRT